MSKDKELRQMALAQNRVPNRVGVRTLVKKFTTHFIAVGPGTWGRGDTKEEAVATLRSHSRGKVATRLVYRIDTPVGGHTPRIDDMGNLVRDENAIVECVEAVKRGKQTALPE